MPPQSETTLASQEARLADLWERMVRTIGIHTVGVLWERAVWEASRKYPDLALIQIGDTGISFVDLDKSYAGRPESEIAEAFGDLNTERRAGRGASGWTPCSSRWSKPVLIIERDGRLALMNSSASGPLGQKGVRLGDTVAELVGKAGLRGVEGGPLLPEETATVRALGGERVEGAEEHLAGSDETPRHFLVSGAPLLADRRMQGAVVVWRDITERKQAEMERERILSQLELERARFEVVIRRMPAGVVVAKAPTGRLILSNEQTARIWRQPYRSAADVEDYRADRGFHPDGRPYLADEWPLSRSVRTGEVVTGEEIEILRGDGTRGTMSVTAVCVMVNQSGKLRSL